MGVGPSHAAPKEVAELHYRHLLPPPWHIWAARVEIRFVLAGPRPSAGRMRRDLDLQGSDFPFLIGVPRRPTVPSVLLVVCVAGTLAE
jgi:hypothetical protein